MVRTNIFLTLPQREKLKKLSEQTGLTSAELVRRAIDEYLEKYKGLIELKEVENANSKKAID